MDVLKQNVGIEIDSRKLKVSMQLLKKDLSIKIIGSRSFKNEATGFVQLHDWIKKKATVNLPLRITMEATGVYYESLAYFLYHQKEYLVHVLLPSIGKAFAKSLNQKSKTDELDARMLGQLGLERNLDIWEPMSSHMRHLKKLNRERLQLIREKTLVSNQLHAERAGYQPRADAIARYQNRIDFIESQILQIETALKGLVDLDPPLKERIDNVCTSKGLRFITVCGVVAEMNGFALFKNRGQVVSYAGYDIVKKESGTSVRGRTSISKKGNAFIRQMLFMPALSASRHCDHHQQYYQRILSKTSIPMKANVAIQRKLLLQIYALFKKNEPYDPNYISNLKQNLKPKLNPDALEVAMPEY